ncbi:uncharacterized protein BDZ99DRAFT_389948 [Mytilinidion resinicola]|uniref:Uncharacterized protein n=1 Tax=Mytilinidion resinicola TaxID=574789 RepID=A0A6A6YMJ3_9PEZI|nr:uncharacterized protein BDZ99DRAFT_389948 [Mytilinidion resinicola]KAF2809214.1 hypothetical protein BDZ99DRAFT_389948 [Mytilinidion resinicola]
MHHQLSVLVEGPGLTPTARSHWSFLLSTPPHHLGLLLNVVVLDHATLTYGFEARSGHPVTTTSSEGRVVIADIPANRYREVVEVVSREAAPRDGVDRCQDWILSALISLEAEELVPAGTAALVSEMVGETAASVAARPGERWIPSGPG